MNTAGRDRAPGGRRDCTGHGPGAGYRERGNQVEKRKNKDITDNQEGRFSSVNKKGGSGCWNCRHKDHWVYQCPKLSADEQSELSKDGGPSLLNVATFNNDIYPAKDKYDGVAFVLPVLVQRRTLNPQYLYLDS